MTTGVKIAIGVGIAAVAAFFILPHLGLKSGAVAKVQKAKADQTGNTIVGVTTAVAANAPKIIDSLSNAFSSGSDDADA